LNAKRKKTQELVLGTMDILDKTGKNTKFYKELFDSMTDEKFESWIKDFLSDPEKNFYMEILPYVNEPVLQQIKKAADYIGIPLEEYVYFRHDGNKDNPIRTREKVPTGYIHLRRLQQILSKKQSYSININQRNMKTGQVTGDDKIARVTNVENFALTAMGADKALKEFLGPRADNTAEKLQMLKKISTDRYIQLKDLSSDPEDSQTLQTVDAYFIGSGIKTDLLSPGLALRRTLKRKKMKEQSRTKYEK
jgi:hypothetical protein